MNTFKMFFTSLLILVPLGAHALDMGVEEAIEAQALKISLDEKTSTGVITGQVCDQCKKIRVSITPKTRAYAGRKQVKLLDAKNRIGREATVIFNKETMEVIQIRW